MFTFASITYNHEKYILEHLESIKYQITHFGQGKRFTLIVSDDASTDKTLWRLQSWLVKNNSLFNEVNILQSKINMGITNNYLRAVHSVHSHNFKVLAGDDLYFKNSIFNIYRDYDLVFSPIIKFQDEIKANIDLATLLLMRYCDPSSIKRLLKYHNFIYAPGVFIKKSIAQDKGLMSFLSKIHWLEDYGKWYYLFHHKEDLHIYYNQQPLILYRENSGISTNIKHNKKNEYREEWQRLSNEWSLKSFLLPKYINPYRYYMKLIQLKVKYYDAKINKEMIQKINTLTDETQQASRYLSEIRERALEFQKNLVEDDRSWKN